MNKFRLISFMLLQSLMIVVRAQFPMAPGGFGQMPFGGFGQMPPEGFGMTTAPGASENTEFLSKVDFKSSNLPIIKIETNGQSIYADRKITAKMLIIDNGNGMRNDVTDSANSYNGQIGIKLRGNSSISFEQKRYTIETRDSSGKDIDVPLLGLPAESDWALIAPYNDISMIRDILAFDLWNNMGHWGPHTRLCELTVNGYYRGVYILSETIKRSENRLDIAKIKKTDTSGRELTGGYILRIDAYDNEDYTFTSAVKSVGSSPFMSNVVWTCHTPDKKKISSEQAGYIKEFIHKTEETIHKNGNTTAEEREYRKYIDVSSFVDYFIHTELSLNADGFKRSAYFYKTKQNEDGTGGKLHAGPVWDFNLAYGNCSFCNADDIEAWVYNGCETNPTPAFWKDLANDKAFIDKVKKRYSELRATILSDDSLCRFIDDYAAILNEAQQRHFKQFDNLLQNGRNGTGSMFNWFIADNNGNSWFAAYTVSSYAEEIATLKEWLYGRLRFLDRHWLE